jgi:hypothetical protein
MRHFQPLTAVIALFAALMFFLAAESAAQSTTSRTTAPARAIGSASVVLKPQQLDFNFGGANASLGPRGDWSIKGLVSHRGLLCGDYSIGVRFGVGSPECSNVVWLTDVSYVTTQRQCNNASVQHSGGDLQPQLIEPFRRITCAERVIRCTGVCK